MFLIGGRGCAAAYVVGACAVLYILRAPFLLTEPQLLAEDAAVFFRGAWEKGPASIFEPYAGYIHFLPRAFALLATPASLKHVPSIYFLASLGTFLVVAALILSERVALPLKPALALSAVLVPHTGEVFGIITNIQWILPLGALAILFTREPPASRAGRVGEAGYLAVFSVTGPFSIFAAPLFVAKALGSRGDRIHNWPMAAIVGAGAVLQLHFTSGRIPPAPAAPPPWSFVELAAFRTVLSPLFGARTAHTLAAWEWLVLAAVAGCIAAGVWRGTYRWQILGCLFFSCALLAGVYSHFKVDLALLGPAVNADRYFYLPKILMTWALIASVPRPAIAVAILAIPLALNPYKRNYPGPSPWRLTAAQLKAGQAVTAPINVGDGLVWSVPLAARPR